MATPTIGEIQIEIDILADRLGVALVYASGPGSHGEGPAVLYGDGRVLEAAPNKQRLLTALRRRVKSLAGVEAEAKRNEFLSSPVLIGPVEYETPDVDVDTMATWEEKAEVLDSIIEILDGGGWDTSTLALVGKVIVDAGFARVEVGRFVKEG